MIDNNKDFGVIICNLFDYMYDSSAFNFIDIINTRLVCSTNFKLYRPIIKLTNDVDELILIDSYLDSFKNSFIIINTSKKIIDLCFHNHLANIIKILIDNDTIKVDELFKSKKINNIVNNANIDILNCLQLYGLNDHLLDNLEDYTLCSAECDNLILFEYLISIGLTKEHMVKFDILSICINCNASAYILKYLLGRNYFTVEDIDIYDILEIFECGKIDQLSIIKDKLSKDFIVKNGHKMIHATAFLIANNTGVDNINLDNINFLLYVVDMVNSHK